MWKFHYCFWLTLTNTLSVWCNPWGQLYPHRKQLHFHFLLWLSWTGSVLFVKAKANKRPLLCLYFKLLWQHLFNTCTHTHICHTCFILISSLRVCSSFRRSFLLPTRMMGTLGQKCFTSGVHFSGIFSGKCQEKKTNETWHHGLIFLGNDLTQ